MAPRLLLLDEITSALDPLLVAEVLDVIADPKRDKMTIVMATHEMQFAQEVADRVVFLDAGQVIEHGPAAKVLGGPRDERTARFLARHIGDR